jgi:hypothetical protein
MTRARFVQIALLWLMVSAMVWLTAIWRWQGQGDDVGGGDILLQLVLLPLALAAVLATSIWLVGRTRREASAPWTPPLRPATAAKAPGADAAPTGEDALEATLPWASAVVLAEHLNLSLGPDALQALETMRAGTTRPGLDAELQDVDGMPVFAARHPELDARAWAEAAPAAEPWLPEAARTLALLEPVLHEALTALVDQAGPDAPGWLAWRQGSRQAAFFAPPAADAGQPTYLSGVARPEPPAAQLARKAQAPLLHIRLVLPPSWPATQRDQAVAWVKAQCGALLDWSEAMSTRGVNWLVEPLMQNEDLWTEVDQMLVRWHREGRPELLLLLAADTAITPHVVERMQARGELFTAQHQVGRMPGEAAAALLLGTAHWLGLPVGMPSPALADAEGPDVAVRLWRPLRTRRDKSADAHGRLGVQALVSALAPVQAQHRPHPDSLQVVADADHRASRTSELYEAVAAVSPEVDPMLAIARVGQACGDLGVAGALVPSVLASAWLRAGGAGSASAPSPGKGPEDLPLALAVHLQSSHERVVVPLAPWSRVLQAAEPQAQAAA